MRTDRKKGNIMFKKKSAGNVLLSCIDGKAVSTGEVPDPVFSSDMLGRGVAIIPSGRMCELYMPADGKITSVSETRHALNILTDDGLELLIHIGVDTVELRGAPFEVLCNEGEHYLAGDVLARIDVEQIIAAEKPVITPLVITNPEILSELDPIYTEAKGGRDAVIQYKIKR